MRLRTVFGLMMLLLVCNAATADERAQARDHYLKGTKAFDLGQYDDAIREYTAAYNLRDDPALLYNIAQAHRLAGHSPEALRFYKIYLAKPRASNRAEVELKVAELQKLIDQQNTAKNLPPNYTRDMQPEGPVAPPKEPEPAVVQTQPTTSVNPEAATVGRRMKIAGIATAAAGVAFVVVGVVFGVLAKSAGDSVTQIDQSRAVFDPSLESTGKTDQAVGIAMLAVGAAAVVAGTVVLVLGVRRAREAPRAVSVLPTLTPQSVGANLTLRF